MRKEISVATPKKRAKAKTIRKKVRTSPRKTRKVRGGAGENGETGESICTLSQQPCSSFKHMRKFYILRDRCYDVCHLFTWVHSRDIPIDPLTKEPLTETEITDINLAYDFADTECNEFGQQVVQDGLKNMAGQARQRAAEQARNSSYAREQQHEMLLAQILHDARRQDRGNAGNAFNVRRNASNTINVRRNASNAKVQNAQNAQNAQNTPKVQNASKVQNAKNNYSTSNNVASSSNTVQSKAKERARKQADVDRRLRELHMQRIQSRAMLRQAIHVQPPRPGSPGYVHPNSKRFSSKRD